MSTNIVVGGMEPPSYSLIRCQIFDTKFRWISDALMSENMTFPLRNSMKLLSKYPTSIPTNIPFRGMEPPSNNLIRCKIFDVKFCRLCYKLLSGHLTFFSWKFDETVHRIFNTLLTNIHRISYDHVLKIMTDFNKDI